MPLPRVKSVETLARSMMFTIEALHLEFSNGVERVYQRLAAGGREAVMVVAIDGDDQLVLIREYMAGFHRFELSLPKGRVDDGETYAEAANRELKEEAGFGARDIRYLRCLSLAPTHMGYAVHVLLARDLYPERLPGDEPEPFEVVSWPMARLDDLAMSPEFTESRAIAALKLVEVFLAREAAGSPCL